MAVVSKRYLDRAKPALSKFRKVLEDARSRDVNESDTVVIIGDFLRDVLGYERYQEITSEMAIRGTFCDLAVKVDGRVRFLIEAKAIGKDLKDNHLRQAVDYAAKEGVEWVILTNGAQWHVHKVRFEKPINNDLVLALDLLDPNVKPAEMLERAYLISREACASDAIDDFRRLQEATSRYVIAQVLLCDASVGIVRRELRRLAPGLKVTDDQVAEVLRNEVIKRDALEGERAESAQAMVKRAQRRRLRAAAVEASTPTAPTTPPVT